MRQSLQGKSYRTHEETLESGVEVKVVLAIIVLLQKKFGSYSFLNVFSGLTPWNIFFISCDFSVAVNCYLEDLPFIHIVVGQRPWVPNRAMLGFEPRAYLQQVGAPTKYIYWYR